MRRLIHGTIAIFDPRSFVNTATKIEVWRKQYRAVILYGLDTTTLKAGRGKAVETFQIKILRGMLRLSKNTAACLKDAAYTTHIFEEVVGPVS